MVWVLKQTNKKMQSVTLFLIRFQTCNQHFSTFSSFGKKSSNNLWPQQSATEDNLHKIRGRRELQLRTTKKKKKKRPLLSPGVKRVKRQLRKKKWSWGMGYQGHKATVWEYFPWVLSCWKTPGGYWGHQDEKYALLTNRTIHIAGYIRRSMASRSREIIVHLLSTDEMHLQ